ncbi:MlaA family lipoprotein [Massilia sp. SM-13]|uniref:MlaA family lipoprotein n=1 Tax=Pseudoduganella rhizocola TaxID=3382643 RepID=UPI0038B647CE
MFRDTMQCLLLAAVVLGGTGCATAPKPAPESAEVARQANDPWEGYNRGMYAFNTKVDKYIARPIGVAYDTVVPEVVQHRVTSFFSNLQEPRTMANQLFQGRPVGAARTLGRFVVNTTAGVGGMFDPASKLSLVKTEEDLGQTLAVWGWEDSRFFVAPLQGPRTVRDFLGGFGDKPLNPTGYIDDSGASMAVTLLNLGSMRSAALPMDKLRAEAPDEYAMVRDRWLASRKHQIAQRQ